MSEHTPEPWGLGVDMETIMTDYRDETGNMTDENWIRGGHPKIIAKASLKSWLSVEEAVANSRRIIACVNACAGFETEDLEDYIQTNGNTPLLTAIEVVDNQSAKIQELEKQRDELGEVLTELIDANEKGGMLYRGLQIMQLGRMLIAKIKEKIDENPAKN